MSQYCVAALKKDQASLCGLRFVLEHLGTSLRASREAVVLGVTPLGKDQPLPARRALRPTTSQLAESVIIMLKEHQFPPAL